MILQSLQHTHHLHVTRTHLSQHTTLTPLTSTVTALTSDLNNQWRHWPVTALTSGNTAKQPHWPVTALPSDHTDQWHHCQVSTLANNHIDQWPHWPMTTLALKHVHFYQIHSMTYILYIQIRSTIQCQTDTSLLRSPQGLQIGLELWGDHIGKTNFLHIRVKTIWSVLNCKVVVLLRWL